MKYPYENYLKLLLLKGYDNNAICKKIRSFGLVVMPEDVINERRVELYSKLPKELVGSIYPPDKSTYASAIVRFQKDLEALNVSEIIPALKGERIKEWDEALAMLVDVDICIAVRALIIYQHPLNETALAIKNRYGQDFKIESYEVFMKYFWDIGSMDRVELLNYISVMMSGKCKNALIDAYHKKEDKIAYKFTGENKLNSEKVLKDIMNEAYMRFHQALKDDKPESVAHISKWADLAIKAADKYDKIFKKDDVDIVTSLVFELKKKSQSDITPKDKVDGDVV